MKEKGDSPSEVLASLLQLCAISLAEKSRIFLIHSVKSPIPDLTL